MFSLISFRRLAASFVFLCGLSATSGEESKPPNIVVIVVDDLGYMDIGANNPNCFYETPHIDAFAQSAMRFTDGYASNCLLYTSPSPRDRG